MRNYHNDYKFHRDGKALEIARCPQLWYIDKEELGKGWKELTQVQSIIETKITYV